MGALVLTAVGMRAQAQETQGKEEDAAAKAQEELIARRRNASS
jgi:hypothetical protein